MVPVLFCHFWYLVLVGVCSAGEPSPCCSSDKIPTESGNSFSSTENSEQDIVKSPGFLALSKILVQFFGMKGALDLIKSTYGGKFISEANSDMWHKALRDIHPVRDKEEKTKLRNPGPSSSSECLVCSRVHTLTDGIECVVKEILKGTHCDLVRQLTGEDVNVSMYGVFAAVLKLIMLSKGCSSYEAVYDGGAHKAPNNPSATSTDSEGGDGHGQKKDAVRVHEVYCRNYGCDCIQVMRDWLFGRDESVRDDMSGVILEAAGLKQVPNREKKYSSDVIFLLCREMKMEIKRVYCQGPLNIIELCYKGNREWNEGRAKQSLAEFRHTDFFERMYDFRIDKVKMYLCKNEPEENTDLICSSGIMLFLLFEFLRLRGLRLIEVTARDYRNDKWVSLYQSTLTPPNTATLSHSEFEPIEVRCADSGCFSDSSLLVQTVEPVTGYKALYYPLEVSAKTICLKSLEECLDVDLKETPESRRSCSSYGEGSDLPRSLLYRVCGILRRIYGPVLPEEGKCVSKHIAIPYRGLMHILDFKMLDVALQRLGIGRDERVGSISILFKSEKLSSIDAFLLEFLGGAYSLDDVGHRRECIPESPSYAEGEKTAAEDKTGCTPIRQRQVRWFINYVRKRFDLVKVCLKFLPSESFLLSFLADGAIGNAELQTISIRFYNRAISKEDAEFLLNTAVSEVIFDNANPDNSFTHYLRKALLRDDSFFHHLKVVRFRSRDFPAFPFNQWTMYFQKAKTYQVFFGQWDNIPRMLRSKSVEIYLNEVLQA